MRPGPGVNLPSVHITPPEPDPLNLDPDTSSSQDPGHDDAERGPPRTGASPEPINIDEANATSPPPGVLDLDPSILTILSGTRERTPTFCQ